MSTYLSTSDSFPLGRGEPANSMDDFGSGQEFPPARERGRVHQFDQWWRWSQRSYVGLDPQTGGTPQAQFNVDGRRQMQRLAPNMFRFIMEFWADAVAVDEPVVEYEGGGRGQDFCDRIMPALMRASRLVTADMVRYGVGVFWSRHALAPEAIDPRFWFPIRPASDPYDSLGEVVATPWADRPNGNLDRLTVYEYPEEDGVGGPATRTTYKLEGLTIGAAMTPRAPIGVDGMGRVVPVRAREGVYGTSDFVDAAEYVAELHRRESSISTALDRHANPHLAVPEGSLTVNADGSVTVNNEGMVIPVPEGSNPPSYVTWDADFRAQENGIARAEQRILRGSNIAPILATPGEFALRGGLPSGSALRRLAVISVNRLKSIRAELTEAWRRVIPAQAVLLAEQGGERIAIDAERIRVEWPPEFSTVDDEIEAGIHGSEEGGNGDGDGATGDRGAQRTEAGEGGAG